MPTTQYVMNRHLVALGQPGPMIHPVTASSQSNDVIPKGLLNWGTRFVRL